MWPEVQCFTAAPISEVAWGWHLGMTLEMSHFPHNPGTSCPSEASWLGPGGGISFLELV